MPAWILIVLLLLAALAAVPLFSPVVVNLDTRRRKRGVTALPEQPELAGAPEVEIRWTLFRALLPLPGNPAPAQFYLGGLRLPPAKPAPSAKLSEQPKRKPTKERSGARVLRFLGRCALDPVMRRAVVISGQRLASGVAHSFALPRRHWELSTQDPALNGMLAGLAYAAGARRQTLGVNFLSQNWLTLEARLYPARLARALLAVLLRLPYRAAWRHWRASHV